MPLRLGDKVPTLTVTPDNGQPINLGHGQWRVVFFFPHVATTHCQLQARRYQALYPEFQALGVDVVGVNGDTRTQQVQFRDLCVLDYPLIEDRELQLAKTFGVLDDLWPGETRARPKRVTYLINPDGLIVRHWTDVRPGDDAPTALAAARLVLEGVADE
ncbi:peroxiredoxin [Deinococcus hohokamensis]|uniref:thioredoxin-dependent peroxiredoxin n=1 Tax=Deinococcus hohokamensis TaxID=309883 RepID=A0ABV9I6Q5_9DEIO